MTVSTNGIGMSRLTLGNVSSTNVIEYVPPTNVSGHVLITGNARIHRTRGDIGHPIKHNNIANALCGIIQECGGCSYVPKLCACDVHHITKFWGTGG